MCHDISVRGPAPGTQLGHPHQGRRWGAVAAGTPGSPPGTPARPGGPGSAGSCLEQRWLRRRHPRPRSPPPPSKDGAPTFEMQHVVGDGDVRVLQKERKR